MTSPLSSHGPILIVGLGRSGTNWLLDLFDLSAETFCRNEPNEIAASPFQSLFPSLPVIRSEENFGEAWDHAVTQTVMRMGERDHPNHGKKKYFYPISRVLKLHRLVQNPRPRALLARCMPSLRQGEWPMPRWLGNRRKLQEARAVLKILRSAAWVAWVLNHRPNVRVFHIVRHPGGFLNSYRNRYLRDQDDGRVIQQSRQRLKKIAEAEPDWARRFGDIDRLGVVGLELWYWLYHTETVHAAGRDSPGYRLVVYEQLSKNPVGNITSLYETCGLGWDPPSASQIGRLLTPSEDIAWKWKQQLGAADREAVEAILEQADGVHFWQAAEVVVG
ncbi:MAG: sulfotransferase [Phycisphaeraceae bacterium]|nr:sulfotransferase [Phycisphaeraceae bacterium]